MKHRASPPITQAALHGRSATCAQWRNSTADARISCDFHPVSNRPCPHRVLGPPDARGTGLQNDRCLRPGEQRRQVASPVGPNLCQGLDLTEPCPRSAHTSDGYAICRRDLFRPSPHRVLGPEPVFLVHAPPLCGDIANPQGILSSPSEASKKLARHGGRIVAFDDPGTASPCRDVHLTLLRACRRLRRSNASTPTRACIPRPPSRGRCPRQYPNQWVQGYVLGQPISSSSSEYRPQQGVFSAGDLDTTAASLLRQYRRVLPAPAPGPPEECGLKRRYSAFDIVRQDSEHATAGAVSVPACIAHALQNAPFADATWAFPDIEIIGLAHPQIVLLRPQAVGPTVIADLRALGGPIRVIEVQGQCSPDSLAQMFEANVPGIRGRIQAGRVIARIQSANWHASEARRLPLGTVIDFSAGVGTALALPIGVGISQRAIMALGLPQLYRGAIYAGGPGFQTMCFPLQRFDSLSQALAAIWDGILTNAPARRPDSFLFGAMQPAIRGDTIRLTLTLLCTPCREERVVWLDLTSIDGPLRAVLMPSVATPGDVGLSGHHVYLNGVQWLGTQYLTHGAIVQVTRAAEPPAHMHLSALWHAIPDLAALSSPTAFPYSNHLMASFEGPTAFEPYFVNQQLALREGRGLNSRTPLCLLLAPGLADVFSLGHSVPSLRAVADFAQTTLIDLYGPGILVDLGIASGEYTVYAFRPADLPGGLSFLVHRSSGLRVGVTVDRTLDTFGPEYIASQSAGLAAAVGNIGLVAVDGLSVDDRPSIELPTDSFTATFLVTNAQPEGEPEAEAASSSSSRLRTGTSMVAIPSARRTPRGASPNARLTAADAQGVIVCPSPNREPFRAGAPKSFAPRPPVPPIPESSPGQVAAGPTASDREYVSVAYGVEEPHRRLFTVFDVVRHVSQDEVTGDHSDVVCLQQALAQAPFPHPGWARPAIEVLPLPVPQFVLLRPGTLCTIIVDARPAGSRLFTLETPFTASPEELLDRVSLFLGNVFEEAQRQEGLQCFFNEVPWALPIKRQLANGDVFSCRPTLEGPGLPLLGPGGSRHTLQRRREAPYFEVLRAVELGSQTITLSFGDRMLEDVLAELVYRRHQLGPVPEGLYMQLCQVQPAPSQGRRELIVLLFCRATDGTFPIVCDGRDVGGHIWVAALDATVPFGALAESGCVPFLDGLPCPPSPHLYPGAIVTLRSAHSGGRPLMMPVSAWWTIHPFTALLASPVPFPVVAPGSIGFQGAAVREAFNALLDVRVARGFALFEGRVAIFGPGSSLVFAAGQDEPTAERIAGDLSVYLLRTFGPGQVVYTRLHLANCALFVYRPASLRSGVSLCLHSLGGGYVLRIVPTADLRTIQEPIFLFPGIDSPVAHVHEAVPNDTSCPGSAQEAPPAFSGAPAQSVAAVPGALEASGPSCPDVGSGTSLAQTAFVRLSRCL